MQNRFFMAMNMPTITHQEKKIAVRRGKPVVYEPDELKDARQKFKAYLSRHLLDTPLEGPVSLIVNWYFPADSRHPAGEWKTTKPDTDNLIKLLKDVMTELKFWNDDAQVCFELSTKSYAEITGIYISLSTLEVKPDEM